MPRHCGASCKAHPVGWRRYSGWSRWSECCGGTCRGASASPGSRASTSCSSFRCCSRNSAAPSAAFMSWLLLVLGFRYFGWRGVLAACVAGAVLAATAWSASPLLRGRIMASFSEVQAYETENAITSSGIRLDLWKKSLGIVGAAPVIGHGTGSIPDQFRRVAAGERAAGLDAVTPDNQVFASP